MKKTITFITLLMIISQSFAQTITVTGATNTNLNKTYTLCNGCGFQYTTVEAKDAGTDSYFDGPASGLPFDQYQIYRKDGVWRFARVTMCSGCTSPTTYPNLGSITSNTTKPPCDWGNGLTMTGDCISSGPTSVKSITVMPTVFTLPQLTATDISNIATPTKGMLVFDLTNNCLKLYNGTTWVCLSTN